MNGQQADITQRLQALRGLNFRFATNRDTTDMVVALIGVHVHHGVIDTVRALCKKVRAAPGREQATESLSTNARST
jgi:hypothetical protein